MRKIIRGGGTIQTVGGTNGTLAIGEDGKPYNPQNPGATSGDGWYIGDYDYLYLTGTDTVYDFSNVTTTVTSNYVYIGNSNTNTGNTIKGGTFNSNYLYVHKDNKLENVTANQAVTLFDTAQMVNSTCKGGATLYNDSKSTKSKFYSTIYMDNHSVLEDCVLDNPTGSGFNSNYDAAPTVKGGVYKCKTFALPNATISGITFNGSDMSAMQNATITDSVFTLSNSNSSSYSTITNCSIKNSVFIGPVTFSGTNTIEDSIVLADPTNQNVVGDIRSIKLSDPDKGIRSIYLDNDIGADFSNLIGKSSSLPIGIWMVGTPTVVTTNNVKITAINPITSIAGLEESDYTLSSDKYTVTLPFNKDLTTVVHVLPLLSITDDGLPDLTNTFENNGVIYGRGWEYRELNASDTQKTLILNSNEYDKFNLKDKTINCPVLVEGVSLNTAPSFSKDVTFDGSVANNYSYYCKFVNTEPVKITLKNKSNVKCGDITNATVELSDQSTLTVNGNLSTDTVTVNDNSTLTTSDFTNSTLKIWGTFSGKKYSNDNIELHNGSSFKSDTSWMTYTTIPNNTTLTAYEGSTIEDGFFHKITVKAEAGATEPVKFVKGIFRNVVNESAATGILLENGYIGQLDAGSAPVKQTGGVFLKRPTSLTSEDENKIHAVIQYSDSWDSSPTFSINDRNVGQDITDDEYKYIYEDDYTSRNGIRRGYVFEGVSVKASGSTSIMSVTTDAENFSYSYVDNRTVSFAMPTADVKVNAFVMSTLVTNENGRPDIERMTVTKYSANGKDAWKGDGWKYEWRNYGDGQSDYCVIIPSNNSCSGSYTYGNPIISCPVIVETDGTLSWYGTLTGAVYNSGTLTGYNSTYTGTVYNLDVAGSDKGGLIKNGKFNCTVYNGTSDAATHNAVIVGGTFSGQVLNYGKTEYSSGNVMVFIGNVENYGTVANGFFPGGITDQNGTVTGGVFLTAQSNGQNEKKIVLAQNTTDTAGNRFTKFGNYYTFPEDSNIQVLYVYSGWGSSPSFSFEKKTTYKNGKPSNATSISSVSDAVTILSGGAELEISSDTYPAGTNGGNAYAGGKSWYYIPDETGSKNLYLNNNSQFTLNGTLADDVTLTLNWTSVGGTFICNSPVYSMTGSDKINGGTFNGCFYPYSGAKIYDGTFNGGANDIAVDIISEGLVKGNDCYIYGGEFNGSLVTSSYWAHYYLYNGTFNKPIISKSRNNYVAADIYGGTFKNALFDSAFKGKVQCYNGFFMADTALDLSTNTTGTYVYGGFFAQKPTGSTKNNAVFYKISDENGYDFTLTDVYEAQTYANTNQAIFTNAYTVKGTKVCVTTESKVTHVKVNDTVTPVADFLNANNGTSSNDGKTLTFTMPDGDVVLQTVPIIKDYELTLPILVDSVTVTPAGGTAETKTAVDGKVSVAEGSTVTFNVPTATPDAKYDVIDEQTTLASNTISADVVNGVGTFTMPGYNASLRQYNQLHFDTDGKPITTGTYTDADGVSIGNGWHYRDTLTISTSAVDISGDTNRVVTVPTTVNSGKLKGFIFTNTVEVGLNFDDSGSFEDTIVYGALTGTTNSLHKLTTTPAGCTVLPKDYTGTLDFTGTAYVSKDMELKVTKPDTITDPMWTIPASVTLTDGTAETSGTIQFKMPGEDTLLTVAEKLVPVTLYDITVALPGDVDFAPAAATDVVTVVPKAAEGEEVTLSFNAAYLPADCGMEFDQWVVTGAQNAAVTVADSKFTMPASNVTVTFTLKSTSTDPDAPVEPEQPADDVGTGVAIVLGVAAAGGVAYAAGTQIWLETHLPDGVIPTNREQLALMLWKEADKPAPQSTTLYTDIAAADTDGQLAARWCTEQGLMKDFDEGTIFKPGDYVFRPQVIKAWTDLQQLLQARE